MTVRRFDVSSVVGHASGFDEWVNARGKQLAGAAVFPVRRPSADEIILPSFDGVSHDGGGSRGAWGVRFALPVEPDRQFDLGELQQLVDAVAPSRRIGEFVQSVHPQPLAQVVEVNFVESGIPAIGPGGQLVVRSEINRVEVDLVARDVEEPRDQGWRSTDELHAAIRAGIGRLSAAEIEFGDVHIAFGFFELAALESQTELQPAFAVRVSVQATENLPAWSRAFVVPAADPAGRDLSSSFGAWETY